MTRQNQEWKVVDEVAGSTQAEIIKGMLEAQGISVILAEEGAGRAIGLGAGPTAIVQVLVPESSETEARGLLDSYYRGDLVDPDQDAGESDS